MEKLYVKTKNLFPNISGERKKGMPQCGMLLFSLLPIKSAVLSIDWRDTVAEVPLLVNMNI